MENKYLGKFGMSEMEWAAMRIVEKYQERENCGISITDMEDNSEMIGFVELVYGGWLKKNKYCYNGVFNTTKEFLDRINGK